MEPVPTWGAVVKDGGADPVLLFLAATTLVLYGSWKMHLRHSVITARCHKALAVGYASPSMQISHSETIAWPQAVSQHEL